MEKVVNNQMVSQSAVTMMLIQMLICLALPIGLAVWVIKRRSHPKKGATKIFFIGMGIFFLFAGVLEGPFRGIARQFQHTPWAYALYGALLAGVFEEVGRFLGFKFIQKRIPDKINDPETPFLYGLGHGGLEMILVGSMIVLSNYLFAMLINSGSIEKVLSQTPASSRSAITAVVKQLTGMSAWTVSLSLLERIMALAVQIALSVVVWLLIVKRKQWFWLLVPIGLHAFIDFPAALTQVGALSVTVEEFLLVGQSLLIVGLVYWLWQRTMRNRQVSD